MTIFVVLVIMYVVFVYGFGCKFIKRITRNNKICIFTIILSVVAMLNYNRITSLSCIEMHSHPEVFKLTYFIFCASILNTSMIVLAFNLNSKKDV